MERKSSGYSVSVQWNIDSDGTTSYRKDIVYMPDQDTEIVQCEKCCPEEELHDLTDKELNEIMEELERENSIPDNFPLKNLRASLKQ
jgi:hypothetical protein